MPKYVRPRAGNPILRHPDGYLVTTDPNKAVQDDDPLVKAFPWAFATDEQLARELQQEPKKPPTEVRVETTAKRGPAGKRSTRS